MIEWLKENVFGPEARLRRLEKEVERKQLAAEFAEKEIPLLQEKEKAIDVLNKKKKILQNIRRKKESGKPETNSMGPKLKINIPKREFTVKTPTDRVYGK